MRHTSHVKTKAPERGQSKNFKQLTRARPEPTETFATFLENSSWKLSLRVLITSSNWFLLPSFPAQKSYAEKHCLYVLALYCERLSTLGGNLHRSNHCTSQIRLSDDEWRPCWSLWRGISNRETFMANKGAAAPEVSPVTAAATQVHPTSQCAPQCEERGPRSCRSWSRSWLNARTTSSCRNITFHIMALRWDVDLETHKIDHSLWCPYLPNTDTHLIPAL